MDIKVITFACISLILLVIVHTIVCRIIDKRAILRWMKFVIFSVMSIQIAGWGILYFYFNDALRENKIVFIEAAILSIALYGIMTPLYLSVFGIIESSIRIRILNEIRDAGARGISTRELLKKYNRDIILKKRLHRFLASGELAFDGTYYRVNKTLSLFWLLMLYYRLCRKLYY